MNRKVDVDGTSQGIVYGYHEGKEGETEFFKKVFVGYTDSERSFRGFCRFVTQLIPKC